MQKKSGSKDGSGISSKRKATKEAKPEDEVLEVVKDQGTPLSSRNDRTAKRQSSTGKKGKSAMKKGGSTAKKSVKQNSVRKSKASKVIKKKAGAAAKGGKKC
jgi:hypothetical protein